jgi:hypothetical protein
MSTRAFLIVASSLIIGLLACLMLEKYSECRLQVDKECPEEGPYVSKSGTSDIHFPTSR